MTLCLSFDDDPSSKNNNSENSVSLSHFVEFNSTLHLESLRGEYSKIIKALCSTTPNKKQSTENISIYNLLTLI